jgi:O-antigen/teichoic acid export membrane protein
MRRNLLANYAGTAFSAAAQVLVIPLYIRLLGENNWGLLAATVALSSVMLAFEAGVSLSVARSFAGFYRLANPQKRLRSLETRYVAASAGLLVIGLAASSPLSAWISGPDQSAALSWAFVMAGAQIVGSLYRSILIGTGDQVALNALLIAFTLLRQVAGLWAASMFGTVTSVVCAFACCFALEAVLRRFRSVRSLRLLAATTEASRPSSGWTSNSSSTAALVAAGAIGAVGTQIDRLLLTQFVDAAALGHYAIAATLSLAALQLIYPVSAALIPRLSQFQNNAKASALANTYVLLAAILAVIWAGALTFLYLGLERWLGSEAIAAAVRPLFLMHLAGTTLNALCIPNYLRLLAEHRDHAIAGAALVGLTTQLISIGFFGAEQSALAGSLAWAAGNMALFLTYFLLQLKRRTDEIDAA